MVAPKHFLQLSDFDLGSLQSILRAAVVLQGIDHSAMLKGRTLALLFEQPSTRTRVSFEVAMSQLGGGAIYLNQGDSQLGRNESISDTAKVMSRMVDAIALRTAEHERLVECSAHASIPVINALSDEGHPCQILADLLTFSEHNDNLAEATIAWFGDVNNVCLSYIEAAYIFGFTMHVAAPPELTDVIPDEYSNVVKVFANAADAARDANLLVTDVWTSMAQEGDAGENHRQEMLVPYRVDSALFAMAAPGAVFTHCLPAHRGEEVSTEVLDGPNSIAWDAAENRLHLQKALLLYLLAPESFYNALST